jgi:alanine dehydrogenase
MDCISYEKILILYNEFGMDKRNVVMFVLGTAAGLIISALFSKKKKEKHHLEKELSNVNQRQFNSKGPEYETLKQ